MAMPQDLSLMVDKLLKRIDKGLKALLALQKDADMRNYGLMKGYPPPKDLVLAKAALETAMKQAVTPEFKETVGILVEQLNRIEDLFRPDPKLIHLADDTPEATDETEEEVVVI